MKCRGKWKFYKWYIDSFIYVAIFAMAFMLLNSSFFNPYKIDYRIFPKQANQLIEYSYSKDTGISERVSLFYCEKLHTYTISYRNNDYCLPKDFVIRVNIMYVTDLDHDNYNEFIIFPQKKDTLYCAIFDLKHKKYNYIKIGKVYIPHKQYNLSTFLGIEDQNKDGVDELYFTLNTKDKGLIRSICRLDYKNKSILRSIKIPTLISECFMYKTNSGIRFVCSTMGYKNIDESKIKGSDQYYKSRLYIFDKDLKSVITPLSFNLKNSILGCMPIKKENKNYIVLLLDCTSRNSKSDKNNLQLILCDYLGNIIKISSIPYDGLIYRKAYFTLKEKNPCIYITVRQGGILKLNSDFEILNKIQLDGIETPVLAFSGDIDGDGEEELYFHDNFRTRNVITKYDFSFPTFFNRPQPYGMIYNLKPIKSEYTIHYLEQNRDDKSTVMDKQLLHNFFIDMRYFSMKLVYYKDPKFHNKMMYFAIFLLMIAVFIWFIRVQVYRSVTKRYELETKLVQLRLKNVINQISPHFTLNSMNAVCSLILKDNKIQAYSQLSKLSKMYTMSLNNINKERYTLKEEITFVKMYLDIQKLRFKNKFDYKIIFDEFDGNEIELIPCGVQTFVENALKYGIKNYESGGLVVVEVKKMDEGVLVSVEDNGIGREAASRLIPNKSTGKGIKLVTEYMDTLNKYYSRNVNLNIIDLFDGDTPKGTRVEIYLDYLK
ncbi:MAG: histidine kinase [Marinifilaceae bacterium]|jgi:hypothetical protein|nr:histidine kinase [Marinifilaceae bacterium]